MKKHCVDSYACFSKIMQVYNSIKTNYNKSVTLWGEINLSTYKALKATLNNAVYFANFCFFYYNISLISLKVISVYNQ